MRLCPAINRRDARSRFRCVLIAAVLACGANSPTIAHCETVVTAGPIRQDRSQTAWSVAQRVNPDNQGGAPLGPIADPAQPSPHGCYFLLDCKDIAVPAIQPPPSGDARPAACTQPVGSHVIVNVPWQDADNGLLLRAAPSTQAKVVSTIPANGVGLIVSKCSDGWCQIEYNCQKGYAAARYLAERSTQFRSVIGVSPGDPEGLNVRNGPGANYSKVSSIPYNGTQVIVHNCQTVTQASWCLVSYQNNSGWVAGRYLRF